MKCTIHYSHVTEIPISDERNLERLWSFPGEVLRAATV